MGFFGSGSKVDRAQKKAAELANARANVIICLRGVLNAVNHRKYRNAEALTRELLKRIRILRRVS